jgi:hypothetical protein
LLVIMADPGNGAGPLTRRRKGPASERAQTAFMALCRFLSMAARKSSVVSHG